MNEDVFSGKWREMLTDDDLERIGGQKDKLIGAVQEKYGQTREQAEREVERRFSEYGQTGGGIASNLKSRVDELGATVSNKASQATEAMSSGVQSARSYFQERDFDELANDITRWVRRYPVQACLIGIGLGYLIARTMVSGDRSHYD
jgi:uncharacterized protein YjbJ (UPF0337 family)